MDDILKLIAATLITIILLIPTSITAGYFLTYGYELYYEWNPIEDEEILDLTPTNHKITAEVNHGNHWNSILNSNSVHHTDVQIRYT